MKLHDPRFLSFDGEPITGRAPPTLLVDGPDLTEQQSGEVKHAYKLFRDALAVSITPYFVQNRVLRDGITVRMVSINGQDTVTVKAPQTKSTLVIPRVYSGVIRDGQVIDGTPLVLRDFRPTDECWKFPLGRSAEVPLGSYSDIKQLAIPKVDGDGAGDSKYTDVQASKFSGRMAKVAQVILGYGKETPTGNFFTRVPYKWKWNNCHGVGKGPDDTAWLIEISSTRGILAMPLPLMKNTKQLKAAHEHVLSETATLIGGLPTGETFPVDAALTAAITAGEVLQLASTADLTAFHGKTPFSSDIGWSFNDDATEAHSVVYQATGFVYPADILTAARTQYKSYHYKIVFTFGALDTSRGTGDPIATCTATLSLVEEAEMWLATGVCPFSFYQPETGRMVRPPVVTASLTETQASMVADGRLPSSYPIHACHTNGVLKVIRAGVAEGTTTDISGTVTPRFASAAWSEDFPDGRGNLTQSSLITETYTRRPGFHVTGGAVGAFIDVVIGVREHDESTLTDFQVFPQSGFWPAGARDSYVMTRQPSSTRVQFHMAEALLSMGTTNRFLSAASGSDVLVTEITRPADLPGGIFPENFVFPTGTLTSSAYTAAVADLYAQEEAFSGTAATPVTTDTTTYSSMVIKLVTDRGTVIDADMVRTSSTVDAYAIRVISGDLSAVEPAFANVSVFGPNLHAAYTQAFTLAGIALVTKAEGDLLTGEPTAKVINPITGRFDWKNYAFAGYL